LPEGPKPPSDRAVLRERVHARAKQLRFRRHLRIAGALISTAAVIAALAGVALLPNEPAHDVRDVATEPTATAEPTASPEPTPSPTVEPTPDPTPTPLVCRNSYDPACGEFRWDPAPEPNMDIEIEIDVEPAAPRVGDKVVFRFTVVDDTPKRPFRYTTGFGDGPPRTLMEMCVLGREPYGPWTPPEPIRTVTEDKTDHTYEEAGTYEVLFVYANDHCHGDGPESPFVGEGTAKLTLEVAPAPPS
jgi:hypothetical protein